MVWRISVVGVWCLVLVLGFLAAGGCGAETQGDERMETVEDYTRAMETLSNWGRWGDDDELGAANFITTDKRRQAATLVQEGITVSLAHDIVTEASIDGSTYLEREVARVSETGAADVLRYSGT